MPVMVFAILASFRPDFVNHYPFYSDAKFSLLDLLVWEIIYISQFVTVEFFFRGFLLSSLQPRFGSLAIAVMCVPYLMLHFTKPWLEAAGAIGFGFFLGILALKSRSIWGGVIVHAGIALCMDCAALIQAENFPINFLR
jgi:membrane protease YdiL (CAAX protease family)